MTATGAPRLSDYDGRVGDCSYGVYIYAFPVQQIVASLTPGGNPYTNTALATVIVIPLALLSWRLVEKPAMALKARF